MVIVIHEKKQKRSKSGQRRFVFPSEPQSRVRQHQRRIAEGEGTHEPAPHPPHLRPPQRWAAAAPTPASLTCKTAPSSYGRLRTLRNVH